MIVAPHYVTRVKSTRLSRLCQDWAQWKRIRAQISFPISRLGILKNGITAHPLSEGIASPQSAGSPFLDILCDGTAIRFLARNDDGFVTGPKARIKFISEASRNGSTVPIVPDPNISDFKPYIFEVYGEPVRHIGEAEYGNMRTGFQHPVGFFPDAQGWEDLVPLEALDFLPIWRVNHASINRVIRNVRQCFTRIIGHQGHITHLKILSH